MTSGGNSFNDFPKIVLTREITIKTEREDFPSAAVGLFLEWARCCSINCTRFNPALQAYLLRRLLMSSRNASCLICVSVKRKTPCWSDSVERRMMRLMSSRQSYSEYVRLSSIYNTATTTLRTASVTTGRIYAWSSWCPRASRTASRYDSARSTPWVKKNKTITLPQLSTDFQNSSTNRLSGKFAITNQNKSTTTQNIHKKTKLGLVAFYDIRPGKGVGLFFSGKISKGGDK